MNNITPAELEQLSSAKNEKEWDATVAAILQARRGVQPEDWAQRVELSGLRHRTERRYGSHRTGFKPIR